MYSLISALNSCLAQMWNYKNNSLQLKNYLNEYQEIITI